MNAINATLTTATDWLLAPTASWPPLATLLLWSAVAGVLMAIGFRYTSNQRALGRAADRGRAEVLSIKLFKDELGGTFRSLGRLLKFTGLRLWHSLPPMVVMLVPFVLVLSQLGLRYEHRPLHGGESVVVELQLNDDAWEQYQDVRLEAPTEIAVETGPVRDAKEQAVYWRIRPRQPSPAKLCWQLGSESVVKDLAIADQNGRLAAVSVRRPGPGLWDRLLNPGEPGFAAGDPVRAIVVHHPPRSTPIFGFDIPWWLTFLIVSILAALVVRPLVKVRF